MATWSFEGPLFYWSNSMVISLLCFVIATAIKYREKRKRKHPDNIVPSKYLFAFSYLCIFMGPIITMFGAVSYLPALCLISAHLRGPSLFLQIMAMECYQLSRLHYCFSRDQIHSDKGYPQWVFTVLFSVLVMWFVSAVIWNCVLFTTECWIEGDGTAFIGGVILFPLKYWIWIIPHVLYVAFEFITVSLYWLKVDALRPNVCGNINDTDSPIHNRIYSILHRILILTYFYVGVNVIMFMLGCASHVPIEMELINFSLSWIWPSSINSLSISYSMFLMQDHNTSEYITFLRFIKRNKCVFCFCCFGPMVNEQYRMLVENVDGRELQNMVSNTVIQSPKYMNTNTGMELSVATRTEVEG